LFGICHGWSLTSNSQPAFVPTEAETFGPIASPLWPLAGTSTLGTVTETCTLGAFPTGLAIPTVATSAGGIGRSLGARGATTVQEATRILGAIGAGSLAVVTAALGSIACALCAYTSAFITTCACALCAHTSAFVSTCACPLAAYTSAFVTTCACALCAHTSAFVSTCACPLAAYTSAFISAVARALGTESASQALGATFATVTFGFALGTHRFKVMGERICGGKGRDRGGFGNAGDT
jgi:hypothetical protein